MRQSSTVARFDRILFVVNPKAGTGTATARSVAFKRELAIRGYAQPTIVETTAAGNPELATLVAQNDLVVAFGGDGTLNKVVHAIVLGGQNASPVVAFLPCGTGNAAARAFNLPRSPQRLAAYVASVRPRDIDTGIVSRDGQDVGAFLLWAGAGVDASLIAEVARRRPSKQGIVLMSQYMRVAAEMLFKYRFPSIQIRSEEEPTSAASVVVANVGALAVGSVTRRADPCDGWLDVIGTCSRSRAAWIGALMLSATDRYDKCSQVVRMRTQGLSLTTGEDVPVHLDGEPSGQLPIDIRVAPHSIRLLARG
jgi:diacylglycerol kinase family enzyme